MTPKLSYGEAWLLETLAIDCLPIWSLIQDEPCLKAWLNRGYHRLGPHELRDTLRRMFLTGDLEAYADDDDVGFAPTDDQLDDALQGHNKAIDCGVSKRGGARWESLARPNWNRYFYDHDWDGQTVEITAGSLERLLEVVAEAQILWNVRMDSASLHIQHVRPWNVRSWKELDVGYRSIVKYSDASPNLLSREEVLAHHQRIRSRYLELRHWATSICGHAYV